MKDSIPNRESTIEVTFDKGHLVTLGERLYVEAVELFRELISNAYDADATQVFVSVQKDSLIVEDDGSGMDREGLRQFFVIGSPLKRQQSVSPRFGRKRIGQFGIGKFAVLTVADEFVVKTRKGKHIYKVRFNRQEWEESGSWQLPVHEEPADILSHEGTIITLTKLKRRISVAEVERYIRNVLPLRAKKFEVRLNGKKVAVKDIAGRRFSFSHQTLYGEISGETVVSNSPSEIKEPGLECRVRGVLVKVSLFGLDPRRHGVHRITGWAEADFLPLTPSRTDFVRDSTEYKIFEKLIQAELERVLGGLKQEVDKRQFAKIQAALKDVLNKLRTALKENPDLVPSTKVIARIKREDTQKDETQEVMASTMITREDQGSPEQNTRGSESEKQYLKENPKERLKPTYQKRFRIARLGITCEFARLGEDGPEVISERNIISINQDHPLYQKLSMKGEILSLHLLRLVSQEVVLMKKLNLPAREAFGMQSRILRDALT